MLKDVIDVQKCDQEIHINHAKLLEEKNKSLTLELALTKSKVKKPLKSKNKK